MLKGAIYALLVFVSLTLIQCSVGAETQVDEIEQYLSDNGIINAIRSEDVFIAVLESGSTIDTMAETSSVTMAYRGEYLNGEVFDNTQFVNPVKLKLNTAIDGLKIGLPYFGKGGRGTIIMPSSYAYGNNPPRGIKKNTVLVYQVNVIDFK